MPDHTLTIDFDRYGDVVTTINCHAPADARCHVQYRCDCEEINNHRIVDGVPQHTAWTYDNEGDETEVTHVGEFDPTFCHLAEWHDNSDEDVRGKITVPVTPSWEGEFYLFDITPKEEPGA